MTVTEELKSTLDVLGARLAADSAASSGAGTKIDPDTAGQLEAARSRYLALKQEYLQLEKRRLFYHALKDVHSKEFEEELRAEQESTLGQLQLQTASSADEIVRMREQAEMLGAELAPARKALSERLAAMTKTLAGVETMDADIERLVGKRIFERKTVDESQRFLEELSSAVSMLTNSTTAKTSEKAELEAKVPTLQADIDRLLQAVLTKESSVLHEQQTIDARKQATERRVLELERVNELLEQILGAKLEMSEGGLFVVQIRRADGDGHGKVNEVHVKLNAETAEVEEVRTHGAFPAEDLLLAVQKSDDVAWLVKQLVLRSNAFWRRHDELEQLRKMGVGVAYRLANDPDSITLTTKGYVIELCLSRAYPRTLDVPSASVAGMKRLRDFDLLTINPHSDVIFDLFEHGAVSTLTEMVARIPE